jgi:folate-binding protein YgfZ
VSAASRNPLNVDQSDWSCLRLGGADRVRFLQGMCTANVAALTSGGFLRASMLNAKGRVLSVFDVVAKEDCLLLFCEPGLGEKTRALLCRHVIMDDVAVTNLEQPLCRVWGEPTEAWSAPPILAACPAPVASAEAVEIRRVEAGIPRYGVDVTEDCFPFESRLREHIDYKKGCYMGQEPVARVAAQGQASRALLALVVDGDAPVTVGAPVSHPDKVDAGTVTSAVVSPRHGPIALAYVHRKVGGPGSAVTVAGRRAVVRDVPLG